MKVAKYQPILCLRTTQFAFGAAEVQVKVQELRKLKKRKLKKEIKKNPVPVVISPWGELCIIDCHHFVFSCWHAGVRKMRVQVVSDLSRRKFSYPGFWKYMAKRGLAHLYDQFGDGPRSPLYLPNDIRGMADDPYRSLAWLVRKAGADEKSKKKFADFKWAEFFRRRRLLHKDGRRGLKKAAKRAAQLAMSSAARSLPGYSGGKHFSGKIKFLPKRQIKGRLVTVPKIKGT
ncbi:MAG: ParB/Srx family N-terminal domain-containing protein [Acidobacteria bacterium]|nr:ParB/Srx family N-terminal domain-containing protein [Acidobacteriota bacterium]